MSGFHPRTIVAPVDCSPESLASLDTTLGIASSPSDVHVVHLIPVPNAAKAGATCQGIDNDIQRRDAAKALRRQLPDENYTQLQIDPEVHDPAYRLADFAKRIGADLIIMPSRGRTGFFPMLPGSLAERVVRLSHCPVLVLRSS